jgi:hypothetical protein
VAFFLIHCTRCVGRKEALDALSTGFVFMSFIAEMDRGCNVGSDASVTYRTQHVWVQKTAFKGFFKNVNDETDISFIFRHPPSAIRQSSFPPSCPCPSLPCSTLPFALPCPRQSPHRRSAHVDVKDLM